MGLPYPACARCGNRANAAVAERLQVEDGPNPGFSLDQLSLLSAAWECNRCGWEWGIFSSPVAEKYGFTGETRIFLLDQPSRYEWAHDKDGNECITGIHTFGQVELHHNLYFSGAPTPLHEQTLELISRSNHRSCFPHTRFSRIGIREAMKNIECFKSQCKSFPQGIEIASNRYSPQWVVLRYLLQEHIEG